MKRTILKFLTVLILVACAGVSLSACNTVEGIGEDISASARKVKQAL